MVKSGSTVWIFAAGAIAKMSLWPLFAPNEIRRYGHLWNRNQYFSRTCMNDKMDSTHQI